eukprot:CAMPEP_0180182362 /NCGR_PEP_ID=MMETSP0986-20121125/40625_1 /TAXON_ID=697907 /ORGANISM="non described non described, Strain CCMP2293" /LENGTH=290 /DNA_ID=CAMNT_0022135725 /DNA_START=217 /DNA_END=1085 /DNA_ORIENTATION=-
MRFSQSLSPAREAPSRNSRNHATVSSALPWGSSIGSKCLAPILSTKARVLQTPDLLKKDSVIHDQASLSAVPVSARNGTVGAGKECVKGCSITAALMWYALVLAEKRGLPPHAVPCDPDPGADVHPCEDLEFGSCLLHGPVNDAELLLVVVRERERVAGERGLVVEALHVARARDHDDVAERGDCFDEREVDGCEDAPAEEAVHERDEREGLARFRRVRVGGEDVDSPVAAVHHGRSVDPMADGEGPKTIVRARRSRVAWSGLLNVERDRCCPRNLRRENAQCQSHSECR